MTFRNRMTAVATALVLSAVAITAAAGSASASSSISGTVPAGSWLGIKGGPTKATCDATRRAVSADYREITACTYGVYPGQWGFFVRWPK